MMISVRNNSQNLSLNGATVVLTGASRGIGLEISRLLAEQKANIIGIARSHTQLERWSEEMFAYGIQTENISFDLNRIDLLSDLAQQIKQCSKRLGSGQIDI